MLNCFVPAEDGGQPYPFVPPPLPLSTLPLPLLLLPQADGAPLRPPQLAVLRRLSDIQMEAISVLDRMQRGEMAKV